MLRTEKVASGGFFFVTIRDFLKNRDFYAIFVNFAVGIARIVVLRAVS